MYVCIYIQALKCCVCIGRNLYLQEVAPASLMTVACPALDFLSGMPLVAKVTQLHFGLAV